MRVYNSTRVMWSATAVEANSGHRALTLFQPNPGYEATGQAPRALSGFYVVSVFSGGVVFGADLPVGSVAYPGSDAPVPRERYLNLSDSLFDC